MKILVAVAALGLCAPSAPVFAHPTDHITVSVDGSAQGGRERVALQVSTEGLNLAAPAGVAKLRKRLERAIAYACNPGDRLDADLSPDYQCRQEMATSAEPALLAIAQGASSPAAY